MKHSPHHLAGLALIDALVALLILSVGMFSISRFQNYVVRNSTEIKSHVEAQHLAREQLETFRQIATSGDFSTLIDTEGLWSAPQEIVGNRAVYQRQHQITDTDWGAKMVAVRVRWSDVEERAQQLEVNGILSDRDLSVSGWLAEGAGNQRGVVNPSGGVAELRDHIYETMPEGVIDNLDGTYYYQRDGLVEVLDASGKVKVVINTIPLTISGHIYYEGNIGNIIVFNSNYGHCVFFPESPIAFSSKKTYNSGRYTCYIAAGWYGSVGVVGIADNERGCPEASRVFVTKYTDPYGIVIHQGVYQNFTGQDFVFGKFTGADPSCATLQATSGWNLDPTTGTLIVIAEPAT